MRILSICLPLLAFSAGSNWPDDAPTMDLLAHRARIAAREPRRLRRTRVIATVFGFTGDLYAGGNARFLGRPINPDPVTGDRCIAHRTLPGWTDVWLTYKGKRWHAYVCDRGTYGCALAPGEEPAPGQRRYRGRWLCTKANHVGRHFGDIDVSAPLAWKMGLRARKNVILEYVP